MNSRSLIEDDLSLSSYYDDSIDELADLLEPESTTPGPISEVPGLRTVVEPESIFERSAMVETIVDPPTPVAEIPAPVARSFELPCPVPAGAPAPASRCLDLAGEESKEESKCGEEEKKDEGESPSSEWTTTGMTLETLEARVAYIYRKVNQRMLKVAKKAIKNCQSIESLCATVNTLCTEVDALKADRDSHASRLAVIEEKLASGVCSVDVFSLTEEEVTKELGELNWKRVVLQQLLDDTDTSTKELTDLKEVVCDTVLDTSKTQITTEIESFISKTRFQLTQFDAGAVLMFIKTGYYALTVGNRTLRIGRDLDEVDDVCDLEPLLVDMLAELAEVRQHFKLKYDDVVSKIAFLEARP